MCSKLRIEANEVIRIGIQGECFLGSFCWKMVVAKSVKKIRFLGLYTSLYILEL